MPALPFLIQGHSLSWSCTTLKMPWLSWIEVPASTWQRQRCEIRQYSTRNPITWYWNVWVLPRTSDYIIQKQGSCYLQSQCVCKGFEKLLLPGPALTIAGLRSCLCLDIRESCADGGSERPSCPACFSHVLGLQACTFGVTMFCSVLITQQDSPCITGS